MYTVSKTFSFCYGHRLLNDPGKCGHFHGHTAKATITLGAKQLDKLGMVCHFDNLKKKVGSWIEANLDHKTVLARKDPLYVVLKNYGEPVIAFDENPTAEFLAKLLYEHCKKEGLPVHCVEVWESPTSKATYCLNGHHLF